MAEGISWIHWLGEIWTRDFMTHSLVQCYQLAACNVLFLMYRILERPLHLILFLSRPAWVALPAREIYWAYMIYLHSAICLVASFLGFAMEEVLCVQTWAHASAMWSWQSTLHMPFMKCPNVTSGFCATVWPPQFSPSAHCTTKLL